LGEYKSIYICLTVEETTIVKKITEQ